MKKTLLVLLVVFAVPSSGVAQQDWREELAAEQVVETDSTYSYLEYGIVKIRVPGYEPAEFQIKVSSEGPADGTISRDNFMSLTSVYMMAMMLVGFAEAYEVSASEFFEAYDYKELRAPIGTPDIELNLRMTDEGFQMEFVDTTTGEVSRSVQTWEEVYSD